MNGALETQGNCDRVRLPSIALATAAQNRIHEGGREASLVCPLGDLLPSIEEAAFDALSSSLINFIHFDQSHLKFAQS